MEFEDGKERDFDSLVFATGYRSTANTWLKVRTQTNMNHSFIFSIKFLGGKRDDVMHACMFLQELFTRTHAYVPVNIYNKEKINGGRTVGAC